MKLSEPMIQILRATADRIIPPDDFPGAWDAGVGDFIDRLLTSGDLGDGAAILLEGLPMLDVEAQAQFGRGFSTLAPDQQDALLKTVESGNVTAAWPHPPQAFFNLLINLTAEGYYSDPGSGGNRGSRSWQMIGFAPATRGRGQ